MALPGRASAVHPFKFQLRRENVDWRRISAVDIDLVMNQLDVNTLQEHIKVVTFCCLDGERCQRCHSPVDPSLVKLFQLAQLTVEWLLHCQEFLTLSLQEAEESLTAASRERKQLLAQQKMQEERVKALTTELKQRKNVIRTQQSMLSPSVPSYPKCLHCDKFFCNPTYLQRHMERRHPNERGTQHCVGGEKTSQVESLKSEISLLKDQILQQQQLQSQRSQENEQRSLYQDLLREIGHLKADVACADRKLEDSRDHFHKEMKFFHHKLQLCIAARQDQPMTEESAGKSQAERDLDSSESQAQVLEKLEQEIEERDKKWESRLRDIESHHESEKNLLFQLITMQLSVSDKQEHNQRLQQEMERELQEKERILRAQEKQLRRMSSSPPARPVLAPVPRNSAEVPELEPKKAVHGVDTRRLSEKKPKARKPEPEPEPAPKKKIAVSSGVKSIGRVRKDIRKEMEQAVIKKLSSLRVDPEQRGLKSKELTSLLAKVQSKRKSFAKGKPETWRHREMIASLVEHKLFSQRRGPPHSSPSATASHVGSEPAAIRSKTPPPKPKVKPKPKTSLFSSDDESEKKRAHFLERFPQYQNARQLLQSKQSKATRAHGKTSKCTSATATEAAAGQSIFSHPEPAWRSARGVTRIAVTEGEK